MTELRSQAALVLDACGPRYHHAIAGTAKVRCYLFCPLHRRGHRMRPAKRIVVVGLWPSQLVNHREEIWSSLGNAVGGSADLVCRALQSSFGTRTVISHHANDGTCRRESTSCCGATCCGATPRAQNGVAYP